MQALGGAADDGSQQLGGSQPDGPRFCAGESVRVRSEGDRVRWRRPHLRTPGYIHGAQGVVVRVQGPYANPEEVAFYSLGPKRTDAYLYTVRFYQRALWAHYAGGEDDTIDVDVYEGWLEGAAHTTSAGGGGGGGGGGEAVGGWAGRGSLLVPVATAAAPDAASALNAGGGPPAKRARRAAPGAGWTTRTEIVMLPTRVSTRTRTTRGRRSSRRR